MLDDKEDDDDDVMDDDDDRCDTPDPAVSVQGVMTSREEEEIDVGHEPVQRAAAAHGGIHTVLTGTARSSIYRAACFYMHMAVNLNQMSHCDGGTSAGIELCYMCICPQQRLKSESGV